MTSSKVLSKLSCRLQSISLRLNKSPISPLQSQISTGVELRGVNDAASQCNCFRKVEVELGFGDTELGIGSARYLNAFIALPVSADLGA
ncbi:hypothetical protein SAY87_018184 [Trapa incisa]|uniref:Uncharacterized protein n=1 Tax=Trapa incisa TaxID=236973 RepID=A0AAN7LBP0_9MYRT|nr:hypothetical protein SAY87_018184 [Trapa incisa]